VGHQGDDDVLVAWLDLDRPDAADLRAVLSDDERVRVERLATSELQRRAVARLALRRQVLGEQLGLAPDAVQLVRDEQGRLGVRGPGRPLLVSSSSSGDVGVLAVASSPRMGVDVEAASEVVDVDRFARRVATPHEATMLDALDPLARRDALARLWTRKEAYLKATGEGIGGGVAHVEVPIERGLWDAAFRPVPGGHVWRLYDLDCPVPGFAAALVVAASGVVHVAITRR
jgi:4'-phosphopantetheinyl transferase